MKFTGLAAARSAAVRDIHRRKARPSGPLLNRFLNGVHLARVCLFLSVMLFFATSDAAVVVHKIDDTSVTGNLTSIAKGKLIVQTTQPTSIPLDEISQIVFKEPPALVVQAAPPPPPTGEVAEQTVGGSLLNALFGGNHVAAADVPPPPAVAVPATAATTAPVFVPTGIFKLTDGDQFHATLSDWAEQKIKLKLAVGGTVQISSAAVSEIWLGSDSLQAKAKKLPIDPGPEDIALVAKGDDVIAVKGFAQGVAGNSLSFRYDDQDRKINLAKVVGLLLRSNSTAPITAFHQLVRTDSGDQFSGQLTGVDPSNVSIATSDGTPLKLPVSAITTIEFLNGRVTYLTDFKPTKAEQTPYFGRLIPYRVNQSLAGGPLILSDGNCPRGIAVHSRCVLQYDISSGFDRFKTRLGFEQPDGQLGRVLARVIGDGKVLYENPDARGDQPPINIDVPVAAVKALTLEIDFGKDQDVGDRVVWANPRLVRGK